MDRLDNKFAHEWHVAINEFNRPRWNGDGADGWQGWMYEAKDLADEVPRMVLLFKREREGQLPTIHQQCSQSETEPVADNHLTCCLGVETRKCEFLAALDSAKLTPEQIDTAKAWTCACHIVSKGGDPAKEGYLLTVNDRMFWERTYESMMATDPDDEQDGAIEVVPEEKQ